MTEMKINIEMDESNDITIKNKYTDKSVVIDYSKKEINARDIYELLSYLDDVHYEVNSNYDSIPEGNEKDYFYEIITIIDNIKNELNALNDNKDDDENSDSEEATESENTDWGSIDSFLTDSDFD